MRTPPKAAGILGALALVCVAGTALADENSASRTAKNGWSTEHSCKKKGEVKRCWTLTIGKAVLNPSHEAADIIYGCNTRNEEWLYLSFFSEYSPRKDNPTLRARWGSELREDIATQVEKINYRGKSLYFYYVEHTAPFVRKLSEHKSLHVFLPFGHQPEEVRFKLANAIPSIKQTMKACHIHRSALGDIHL